MRLQEMFYLIKNALDDWHEPEFSEQKQNSPNSSLFRCKNSKVIIDELKPLQVLIPVEETIKRLNTFGFISNIDPYYSSNQVEQIKTLVNRVHLDLIAMKSMCDTLDIEENTSGFDVKLPPSIELCDLSDCTKDLEFVFSRCPTLKAEGSEIKLRGVDIGSAWLTFTLVGIGVEAAIIILSNLAALIDKVIVLRSHALILKQQEEELKKTQKGNELLEKLVDLEKEKMDILRRAVAEEIASSNDITDNEVIEGISQSLQKLDKWMERGLEIYPAISSPSEVKTVFPPLEIQALPNINPQLLTAQSESSGK